MRKTQVALAAMALVASTAVLADGVNVKGCVDATVVNSKTGTVLGGAGDGCASQFGLYGASEEGGITSGFNLETGFSTANGTMGNGGNIVDQGIFNRLANVYMGNGTVTFKLGMQKSPWIEAAGGGLTAYGMNGVGVPALAIINPQLAIVTQSASGFFIANSASVQITSGGVDANLLTVVNPESSTNDSYTALRVSTNSGPASINLGYESRKNLYLTNDIEYTNAVVSTAINLGDGIGLNAAYSRQNAGSGNATSSVVTQTGYILGASYKMNDQVGFGVTYARNNKSTAQKMLAVSAQYNFSSSLVGYVNVSDFTSATALNNAGTDMASGTVYSDKIIGVGIMKSF